jgi:hypothetical protein
MTGLGVIVLVVDDAVDLNMGYGIAVAVVVNEQNESRTLMK